MICMSPGQSSRNRQPKTSFLSLKRWMFSMHSLPAPYFLILLLHQCKQTLLPGTMPLTHCRLHSVQAKRAPCLQQGSMLSHTVCNSTSHYGLSVSCCADTSTSHTVPGPAVTSVSLTLQTSIVSVSEHCAAETCWNYLQYLRSHMHH